MCVLNNGQHTTGNIGFAVPQSVGGRKEGNKCRWEYFLHSFSYLSLYPPFCRQKKISHSGEKCTAAELGLLAGGRLAVVQRGLRRRRGGGGGVPNISALLAAAATTWPAATTR